MNLYPLHLRTPIMTSRWRTARETYDHTCYTLHWHQLSHQYYIYFYDVNRLVSLFLWGYALVQPMLQAGRTPKKLGRKSTQMVKLEDATITSPRLTTRENMDDIRATASSPDLVQVWNIQKRNLGIPKWRIGNHTNLSTNTMQLP